MDLCMLDVNVFSDEDEEVFQEIRRPYMIRNRPSHFEQWDNLDFYSRFRLKKRTVLELLGAIQNQLTVIWNINRALTPINMLLLALRFYATGNFLKATGDFVGVSMSTACRIVKRVSVAIATLRPTYIKMPTTLAEIRNTQQGFYRMHRFPKVIGCIDCTHIRIQNPGGEQGEVFRNRKGFFSLNVQVICDYNLKAVDIVGRWPGSAHDATIFNNSSVKRKFELNEFGNGLLLGDSGYPVEKYLLTPLANVTTPAEERYNSCHISTRNIIERFFGVWKRRFPVLSLGMRLKTETVQAVIVATAVLHNIARAEGEEPPAIADEIDAEFEVVPLPAAARRNNGVQQALIADYFSGYEANCESQFVTIINIFVSG